MCIANAGKAQSKGDKQDDGRPKPIAKATDVPLGDGLADAAKTSILSRRERIRRAVEEAGG